MAKSITKMNEQEFQEWFMSDPETNFEKLYTKKYINQINWDYVSIETIQKYKDSIDWDYISAYQYLSEAFIEKHKALVNWNWISIRQKLSEPFIEKYKDLVDWSSISILQPLSEDFIRKHKNKVDWSSISKCQQLSEPFIKKYKNFVNWDLISMFQHLSEYFIEKHKNLVNWYYISYFQRLSEDFIENHKDLVDWENISKYQSLSDTFVETHKNELNMSLVNDNWLNKNASFKKKAVIDTGLYECHEDYFIAYKGIRSDRYSAFNFQYKYLPGNTYTCFADGSVNENSFGLSVWDKANARDYCPELIIKCKVFYKDVARVVHNGGKIRCSKIAILD